MEPIQQSAEQLSPHSRERSIDVMNGTASIRVISPSHAQYQRQVQMQQVQGSAQGSFDFEGEEDEGDGEIKYLSTPSDGQQRAVMSPSIMVRGRHGAGHVRFTSVDSAGRSGSKYAPGNIILLDDPDLYRPATPILNWQGPKRSLKSPKLQLWLFMAFLQTVQMVVLAIVPEAINESQKMVFVATWIALCAIFGVTVSYMSVTRHLHQLHSLMESINTPLDMDLAIERLQMGRFSRFEETWKIQVGIVKMFCRLLKHHHGVHPVSGQPMQVNAGWSREMQRNGVRRRTGGGPRRMAQEGDEAENPDDEVPLPESSSTPPPTFVLNGSSGGGTGITPTSPQKVNLMHHGGGSRRASMNQSPAVMTRTGSALILQDEDDDDDELYSVPESDLDYQSEDCGVRVEQKQHGEQQQVPQSHGKDSISTSSPSGMGGCGGVTSPPAVLSTSSLLEEPRHSRRSSLLDLAHSPNNTQPDVPRPSPVWPAATGGHNGGGRRRSKSAVALDGDPLCDNDKDWDVALGPDADPNKSRGLMLQVLKGVRLGEDLSKTPLPVDILEPRSLLEKLSDLFVHPKMLGEIGKESDPALRAVAVCRWLVSGFSVRPKGPRKPYNPILGETFECTFAAGTPDEVRYVAEQVSHHPPASNLVAKHLRTGTTVIASFWPTSKLITPNTGASVGDGRITVSVPAQNDVYELTWPNVRCSGLLKAPAKIELCGEVDVISSNTNIKGLIDFVPKGWVSGTYDSIKGSIAMANAPKVPLYTLAGIWHSQTTVTRVENGIPGLPMVLYDTSSEEPVRPQVGETYFRKPSRAIWVQVTIALRDKDAAQAQKMKEELEANERTVRRAREARGEEYLPQLFRMVDRPKKPAKATWQFIGPKLESTGASGGRGGTPIQPGNGGSSSARVSPTTSSLRLHRTNSSALRGETTPHNHGGSSTENSYQFPAAEEGSTSITIE